MAAITAAVIAGVGTAATVGMGAYQASQTPSGPGATPTISKLPQDPVSQAMRQYYARMTVANQGQMPPSFQSIIASGGDMSKAKFPLIQPGLTPNEAAGLGFVGGHGETIPYVSAQAAQASQTTAPGAAGPTGMNLSPDQTFYMAQERARQAQAQGQPVGPWANRIITTQQNLNKVNANIARLQGMDNLTHQQQNKLGRLQTKQQNILGRQSAQLGGARTTPVSMGGTANTPAG